MHSQQNIKFNILCCLCAAPVEEHRVNCSAVPLHFHVVTTTTRTFIIPLYDTFSSLLVSVRVLLSVIGSQLFPRRVLAAKILFQCVNRRQSLNDPGWRVCMHVYTKRMCLWSVATIWNFLVYLTKLTENWLPTVFCVTYAVLSALQQPISTFYVMFMVPFIIIYSMK